MDGVTITDGNEAGPRNMLARESVLLRSMAGQQNVYGGTVEIGNYEDPRYLVPGWKVSSVIGYYSPLTLQWAAEADDLTGDVHMWLWTPGGSAACWVVTLGLVFPTALPMVGALDGALITVDNRDVL